MRLGAGAFIGLAAVATAALTGSLIQRRANTHVVAAGFWFDRVTYEAPALEGRGGPLDDSERTTVREVARQELRQAFSGWRLEITDNPRAHYRVRVLQRFAETRLRRFGVAESRSLGPLGGDGAVSFSALAPIAVTLAPPGTTRPELVEAIGRGLGRVAAHELAHQIVPGHNLHASADPSSYDFDDLNRVSQFYGPARWDLARPRLEEALGLSVATDARG
jgi:hypothetical protein